VDAVEHGHLRFSKLFGLKSQLKDAPERQTLLMGETPVEPEMLRMLSSLKVLFAGGTPYEPRSQSDAQTWLTDPLSHPVLNTMSERELGDVPFRLTARRTVHETTSWQAGFGGRC
jgi:hypothetical protein